VKLVYKYEKITLQSHIIQHQYILYQILLRAGRSWQHKDKSCRILSFWLVRTRRALWAWMHSCHTYCCRQHAWAHKKSDQSFTVSPLLSQN